MAELRWILAALSVLLLAGIWWWGARRSRAAPAAAGGVERPQRISGEESQPSAAFTDDSDRTGWGVSPFEPLSIRTADFEEVSIDRPMTAHADELDASCETTTLEVREDQAAAIAAADIVPDVAAPAPAAVPAAPAAEANSAATQRIVSIRVCAADEARWPGPYLLAALEDHGLAYGRYQVFHRKHSDGRTLFCAASLVEPGTFNLENMPREEFRGLTLFAVLPGPMEPLATLDALIDTATQLAHSLRGVVQDSKGIALSAQRALALREDVARFQESLSQRAAS